MLVGRGVSSYPTSPTHPKQLANMAAMEDRAVAFTDAFNLLPAELQECVRAKRMASITILGNLKDAELQKVFGYMPKQFWNLVWLARALEKMSLDEIHENGLPKITKPERDYAPSVVVQTFRKPLVLPKKTPPILPKSASSVEGKPEDHHKEKAAKAKKGQAINYLWAAFLELGVCGTVWTSNFEKESYANEAKYIVTDGWVEQSGLLQHLVTLDLWKTFAKELTINWMTPDSVSIRTFLGRFKEKGATVPKRHLDSLRWLEQNIGLAGCTSLERVKRFCDAPVTWLPVFPQQR